LNHRTDFMCSSANKAHGCVSLLSQLSLLERE
jgi:hypothetical protein